MNQSLLRQILTATALLGATVSTAVHAADAKYVDMLHYEYTEVGSRPIAGIPQPENPGPGYTVAENNLRICNVLGAEPQVHDIISLGADWGITPNRPSVKFKITDVRSKISKKGINGNPSIRTVDIGLKVLRVGAQLAYQDPSPFSANDTMSIRIVALTKCSSDLFKQFVYIPDNVGPENPSTVFTVAVSGYDQFQYIGNGMSFSNLRLKKDLKIDRIALRFDTIEYLHFTASGRGSFWADDNVQSLKICHPTNTKICR